ncbi:MAG: hypothetical protein FJ303_23495 [Planctomycetes bacterium]|nr:hypothetical protein [Planctomycetota bacterium]
MDERQNNWQDLAALLGLPTEEAVPRPVPVPPPAPPVAESPAPLSELVEETFADVEEPAPIEGEDAEFSFAPRAEPLPPQAPVEQPQAEWEEEFDEGETVDEIVSPEEASDVETSTFGQGIEEPMAEAGGDDQPRRGRRRRRRGRRRGGDRDNRPDTRPQGQTQPQRRNDDQRRRADEARTDAYFDEEIEESAETEEEPAPASPRPALADTDFSDWNVPSWDEIIASLHRPDR